MSTQQQTGLMTLDSGLAELVREFEEKGELELQSKLCSLALELAKVALHYIDLEIAAKSLIVDVREMQIENEVFGPFDDYTAIEWPNLAILVDQLEEKLQ